jgi:hypothetical protein
MLPPLVPVSVVSSSAMLSLQPFPSPSIQATNSTGDDISVVFLYGATQAMAMAAQASITAYNPQTLDLPSLVGNVRCGCRHRVALNNVVLADMSVTCRHNIQQHWPISPLLGSQQCLVVFLSCCHLACTYVKISTNTDI